MLKGPEGSDSWKKMLERAGVDLSPLSQGVWNFDKDGLSKAGSKEIYNIDYGLVKMDLTIDPERVALKWDANLPEYMIPSQSRDQYSELMKWFLTRIPSRLFRTTHNDTQLRQAYKENSSVELVFDDKISKYKLSREEEALDLVLAFVKPDEKIKRMIFTGSNSRDFVPNYILGINYGSDLVIPSLSISTHMEYSGEKAWNSDILKWVLGTHRNGIFLNESKVIVDQLSAGIGEKITNAFQSAFRGYPQI